MRYTFEDYGFKTPSKVANKTTSTCLEKHNPIFTNDNTFRTLQHEFDDDATTNKSHNNDETSNCNSDVAKLTETLVNASTPCDDNKSHSRDEKLATTATMMERNKTLAITDRK